MAMQPAFIKPSMLAFAHRDRLMSIHDGNLLADARAGTFLRSFLPWRRVPGTRNYHAFDVVISGGNPLLAAILLHRAAARGLKAAVALPEGDDDWPFDLAMSPEGGALVAASAGIEAERLDYGLPLAQAVMRRTLLEVAGRAALIPAEGFILSKKHPAGEVALYPADGSPRGEVLPDLCILASEFRSSVRGLLKADCLPDRKTAVFARRLILTGRPPSFTETSLIGSGAVKTIDWQHPAVVGTGTASSDVPDGASAARTMVEDVLSCARGLPLEGINPA